MAIEKIVLLNLTFCDENLYDVLFQIYHFHDFYPQISKDAKVVHQNDCYMQLKNELIYLASEMKLELNRDYVYEYSLNIEKTKKQFHELETEIMNIKRVQNQLIKENEANKNALLILHRLDLMNINLNQLLKCQYISIRFGRITRKNLKKIHSYDDHPFLFYQLGDDHQYVLCCYVVTCNLKLKVDSIFYALGFENIQIDSFVYKTSEELENEIRVKEEHLLHMNQKMELLKESNKIDLLKIYATVSFLCEIEEYKDYVVDLDYQYMISGFLPQSQIDKLKEQMKDINLHYQELSVDNITNQGEIPLIVNNAKIVKPFELMSQVKQSDRIDTTFALAILYYLVFIIFFGDLGVGAVMALLGLLMRRKKMGTLLLSLAIATILGGLLYGNLFYTINLYRGIFVPINTFDKMIGGIVVLVVGMVMIRLYKKCINK